MNFQLSDEQRLLEDAIGRLVSCEAPFGHRGGALWKELGDQGFLGLPTLGGGAIETMIVMRALGRELCVEPFLEGVVRVAPLAEHRQTPGQTLTVIADQESGSRHCLHHVETRARRAGAGFVIDGAKSLIAHADRADACIVAARTSGEVHDLEGITLFEVHLDRSGVERTPRKLQDGRTAADIRLVNAQTDRVVGEVGNGLKLLEACREAGIAAVAAETVGILDRLLELTLEHLGARRQFGRAIGAFQALQHRAAEMLVDVEQARSMALYAALMLIEPDPAVRRRALSQVKAVIGRAGRAVGHAAVQLHGGLGVSDEHFVGHALKRIVAIEQSFGDREHHLQRLADVENNETIALR